MRLTEAAGFKLGDRVLITARGGWKRDWRGKGTVVAIYQFSEYFETSIHVLSDKFHEVGSFRPSALEHYDKPKRNGRGKWLFFREPEATELRYALARAIPEIPTGFEASNGAADRELIQKLIEALR